MKITGKLFILVLLLMSLALVLNNCGSSSNSDPVPNNNSGTCGTTCDNVDGSWTMTDNVSASACGSSYTDVHTVTLSQNGCSITASGGGNSLNGCINGSTINWSGSYPEDGGITTITSVTLTASGNSVSGNASWSWTDGSFSCSGTTSINGSKN